MTAIPVAERAKWIGASEAAALFGVSRFSSRYQLWHEKMGNLPPKNLDRNERVMAGKHLETGIAAWASEKWHWPIRNVSEYSPHPRVLGLGASLDFAAIEGGAPVEIKSVDYGVFRDDWEADGDVITDAPVDYLVQVQTQIACRNAPYGWLVACVGGNKVYRMEVPRHEPIIARIEAEADSFWESIRENIEPKPDFLADAATIATLYGGKGGDFIDLRDNERATALAQDYMDALAQEKAFKDRKKACQAELVVLMRDAQRAVIDGGFSISASHIAAGIIERTEHWRFNIRKSKG